MKSELLPIGSVLVLEGGTKKVMISGYKMKSEEDGEVYDYVGCIFPEGFMENVFVLFNNNQIKEVFFEGYRDEELEKYNASINNQLTSKSGRLEPVDGKANKGRTRRSTNRPPSHPVSASEMRAKYATKEISGGQDELFDLSRLQK